MVISHKNLIQLFDLIKSRWFSAQRPRISIAPFRHRLEAQGRDTHTESTAWCSKTLDLRLSRLGSLLHWLRRSYWDRALKLSFKDQRSFVWESRGKGTKGIPGRGRTMCAKGTVTKGNTVFTEMRRVCDSITKCQDGEWLLCLLQEELKSSLLFHVCMRQLHSLSRLHSNLPPCHGLTYTGTAGVNTFFNNHWNIIKTM